MTTFRRRTLALLSMLLVAAVGAIAAGPAGAAPATDKAVFSITENDEAKWNLTLTIVGNLQKGTEATGGTDIEVVAFGPGVLPLKAGSPLAARVLEAQRNGVKILACKNSMTNFKLNESEMLADLGYVPAGVVEVMRKEQQGWAYVRP